MGAASAEVQSVDRHGMSAVAGDRAHEENLVERELAVRERAAGDAKPCLEIDWRERFLMAHQLLESRQRTIDDSRNRVTECAAARVIPHAVRQLVGSVLNTRYQYMLAMGCER